MTVPEFQRLVWDHYRHHARPFPWRETSDPYAITVSELMLQQTQAERVIPKYQAFLRTFPTWNALAEADTQQLLLVWQGLGYNRRALNLRKLAQAVVADGLPQDEAGLRKLPGVGPYTAGAILAFACNEPVVMIETNIRRAFLHHFFPDNEKVTDNALRPLISQAVDQENPREWYYALMDYGAWLAKRHPNANRRSRHYTRQSRFAGSLRQLRGEIIRYVTGHPETTVDDVTAAAGQSPERVALALQGLARDGFLAISSRDKKVTLLR